MSRWTRALRWIGERFPQKTLHGRSGPYLTRYTLADLGAHGAVYLHQFHRGDEDEDLHSHPWWALGLRLAGRYSEERRHPIHTSFTARVMMRGPVDGWSFHRGWGVEDAALKTGYIVVNRVLGPGDVVRLEPDTFHRVDLLDEEAWSLLFVGARSADWGFWSRWTGAFTPWREFIARKFSDAS